MAKRKNDWANEPLHLHTEYKHKILRDYIFDYICIRCGNPLRTKFKLAFIDGFCGGGRYNNGAPGSPLIFVESLRAAYEAVKFDRLKKGIRTEICFECLLLCNDADPKAIHLLKGYLSPLLTGFREACPNLKIIPHYLCGKFEEQYPELKKYIIDFYTSNILFNLDQNGWTHIKAATILDMMALARSVEIFYTFMLGSVLRYTDKSDIQKIKKQLMQFGIPLRDLSLLESSQNTQEVIGRAEEIFWRFFRKCASYASPLAIRYKGGYGKYWLVHFAKHPEARRAYNDVLHRHANGLCHIGGFGLLSYNTKFEGMDMAYLFDGKSRKRAEEPLIEDTYNLLRRHNDTMKVRDFLESVYRQSFNHSNDIMRVLRDNPDIGIITPGGGERKKRVESGDTIMLKPQKSFFRILIPEK